MKLNPSTNFEPDLTAEPASQTSLELERFLPYRLSVLTNRISTAIGRVYVRRFGLTVPEWRVMAVLGRFGAMSANAVCDRTAMDKLFDIAKNEKDPELRKKAIFWLGQSRDPRVQQFLLDLINR